MRALPYRSVMLFCDSVVGGWCFIFAITFFRKQCSIIACKFVAFRELCALNLSLTSNCENNFFLSCVHDKDRLLKAGDFLFVIENERSAPFGDWLIDWSGSVMAVTLLSSNCFELMSSTSVQCMFQPLAFIAVC